MTRRPEYVQTIVPDQSRQTQVKPEKLGNSAFCLPESGLDIGPVEALMLERSIRVEKPLHTFKPGQSTQQLAGVSADS
jgi:hypothetical protein